MVRAEMERYAKALNRSKGTILCARLERAYGLASGSRGLIGRRALERGSGMAFRASRWLPMMWMHMFLMQFPIDIVFIGGDGRVLKIDRELKPWRVSSLVLGAHQALELEAGAAQGSRTEVGDQIVFEPV